MSVEEEIHAILWNGGELAHHQAAEKTAQLLTGPLAALLAKVQAVADLIAEEEAYRADDPAWEITVVVPAKAGDDVCERIFDAVADTAYEVEPERKDWDVFVSSVKNPTAVPTHLLRRILDGDR